jgi:L-asparaginase II
MSNPILIEVTRGPLVESAHTGSLVVASATGQTVLSLGDIGRPVFPRSAIKAVQCLPLIETGAADRFGFGEEEIALACASHSGTPRHVAIAAAMLVKAGLGEEHLGCGAHDPQSAAAARALIAQGLRAGQLHNNCSGKHAGMLATAVHLGVPATGYTDARHPVQARVRQTLSELTGLALGREVEGIDGCSVPNWAMPLSALATLFAKVGTGEGMPATRQQAMRRIRAACWAEPELVAGPGRGDTIVMQRLKGRVFIKTGAEGVYCGAFPELGLGFALKIDDGAKRAAAGTAIALVEHFVPEARGILDKSTLRTWRGAAVGEIRSSSSLARALDRLRAA